MFSFAVEINIQLYNCQYLRIINILSFFHISLHVSNTPSLSMFPCILGTSIWMSDGFHDVTFVIFSSGVNNFMGGPFCEFQYISIAHSVDESKRIYLPREIQHVGDKDTAPVTSLTELSLRALYMAQAQSKSPYSVR